MMSPADDPQPKKLSSAIRIIPLKLSVVVPVFNEREFIEEVLRRVQEAPYDKEVVIVDDCSTDGTRQWLEQVRGNQELGQTEMPIFDGKAALRVDNLRIFFQALNQGKGAALRRGFAEAAGDVVVVQDADLEYDPQDYPKLLEPIYNGRADVVYGSRFLGGPQRVHFFWHYVANTLLTLFSDALSNLKLTDMETGYKAFRIEVLRRIQLKSNRFGFEPEITAKVAKGNWRVFEVPISYWGRTYSEGKKITWRDGLVALWCILRFNLFD